MSFIQWVRYEHFRSFRFSVSFQHTSYSVTLSLSLVADFNWINTQKSQNLFFKKYQWFLKSDFYPPPSYILSSCSFRDTNDFCLDFFPYWNQRKKTFDVILLLVFEVEQKQKLIKTQRHFEKKMINISKTIVIMYHHIFIVVKALFSLNFFLSKSFYPFSWNFLNFLKFH